MNAKELLDAGDLKGTVQELNESLRTRPTDRQHRVFLFEALCFLGDYDRAQRQLDVLSTQLATPADDLAIQVYRHLLAAERRRQQVFAGAALPKFLVTPPRSVEQYAVLLAKLARAEECRDEYADAEEATPAAAGRVEDRSFAHIRDADDRVAAVLEVFHGSEYLWIPFEQIRTISIAAPRRLRDLLWLPAVVGIEGQPSGDVFIPALYVNSHLDPNDQVKLGRLTEWKAIDDQIVTGVGQRVLVTDEEEHGLLSVRSITIEAPAPATPPA